MSRPTICIEILSFWPIRTIPNISWAPWLIFFFFFYNQTGYRHMAGTIKGILLTARDFSMLICTYSSILFLPYYIISR